MACPELYSTILTMRFKLSLLFASCLFVQIAFTQSKLSLVQVDPKMKDSFSFAQNWDYDWDIFRYGNGKFSAVDGRKIKAEDTAHLYFTANCSTNVQGGYTIRYCYADKIGNTLRLTFSDGLPAYASVFYVYVIRDSFYFKPKTVHPASLRGEIFSYETTKQQLMLNKTNYKKGEPIIGYVHLEFIETYSAPDVDSSRRQYYLNGFIRTAFGKSKHGR